MAEGGRFGGWALYIKDNRLTYAYSFIGEKVYKVSSSELPTGEVKAKVVYEAKLPGGVARLYVNGQEVGQVAIEKRTLISGPGVLSLGKSALTPVTGDYETPFVFSGTIREIKISFLDQVKDYSARLHELKAE